MSISIGVSGATKAVPSLFIGTSGGNRPVVAGYVGTASGNRPFYTSSPPPPPPPPPGAPVHTSIDPTFTNASASYSAAGGYYEYGFSGTAYGGVGELTTVWYPPAGFTVIFQSATSITLGVAANSAGTHSGTVTYSATDNVGDQSSASAPISVTIS